MKKLLLATIATIALSSPALAQVGPKGGFNDSNATITTVKEALKMKDDSFVVMQGHIEQRVGDEDYMFRDETGVIKVEIDEDKWNGLVVSAEDKVQIRGEIDKGWTKTEIEVSEIVKVK